MREATAYARSLNIVLIKVPPGLTWLCQPADAVWIKLIKDGLRRHWLLHLQDQIAAHRAGATTATFEMEAPDRRMVARWASEAWKDIPASMIMFGFAHCKFDVETVAVDEPDETIAMQELLDAVAKALEKLAIVDPYADVLHDEQDVVDQRQILTCVANAKIVKNIAVPHCSRINLKPHASPSPSYITLQSPRLARKLSTCPRKHRGGTIRLK